MLKIIFLQQLYQSARERTAEQLCLHKPEMSKLLSRRPVYSRSANAISPFGSRLIRHSSDLKLLFLLSSALPFNLYMIMDLFSLFFVLFLFRIFFILPFNLYMIMDLFNVSFRIYSCSWFVGFSFNFLYFLFFAFQVFNTYFCRMLLLSTMSLHLLNLILLWGHLDAIMRTRFFYCLVSSFLHLYFSSFYLLLLPLVFFSHFHFTVTLPSPSPVFSSFYHYHIILITIIITSTISFYINSIA